MKKIYSTLALSAMFLTAAAQQLPKTIVTANPVTEAAWLNNNNAAKTAATATLMPSTFNTGGCATNTNNVVFYSSWQYTATPQYTVDAVGYTFGTNLTTYTVTGLGIVTDISNRAAQKYNVVGNVNVTGILVATAIAEGTGMVTAKVYNENLTTKGPGTQMGASATLPLASFTGYDLISFGAPVAVANSNFFASIEAPAIGGAGEDTLAIASTVAGCSSTDSLAWTFNVVNPPVLAGGWASVKSALGANLDLLIFPVVDITTSTGSISRADLTLLAAFPNPAANEITINFGLKKAGNAEIEIFDVTGKLVNTIKMDNLEVGNHNTKVDLSSLNSGVYMYSVKSQGAKMFSKFTVTK